MNAFPCAVEKCGRKFNKKEELKEHMMRRHSGHLTGGSLNSIKVPPIEQHSETTLNLKANKIIMTEIVKAGLKKPFFMPNKKKPPTPLRKQSFQEKTPEIPTNKENLVESNLRNIEINAKNNEKNLGNSLIDEKSHENTTSYSMSFNKEGYENFAGNLVDLNKEKKDFEDLLMKDDDDSEPEIIDSPERNEKVEYEQVVASKEKLTEAFLIKKSGIFEKIEHITTLVLRDENLYVFESNENLKIDRFISLEYLCLSHNKLFNVYGIGECVNLIELNLSFNNIEDIYPLKNCQKLEKLWLSNNRISEIKVLQELKKLKLVSLYKNKLRKLDDIIVVFRQLPKIEELDLDGNPATRKYHYKYDVLYSIQLSKLDGEYVSEIDYELAKSFKKERVAQSRNLDDPNLQRPSTAPGKIRSHFVSGSENNGGERNYSERFKDKIGKLAKEAHKFLNDIPEGDEVERYYELEQELEVVKGERNQLRKELEESRAKEDELCLKIKNLETDAIIKQIESNSVYIMADENKTLKDKLRVYQQIIGDDTKPESVYLEKLFIAHMKIDELLAENSKLQCQVGPKPEKTKQTPNFYNTFSHFPKFKDSSETSFIQEKPFLGQIKRPSLNKSFTSFSNDDKMKNVEVEFQKNSENIEKLKHELRSMMESVDEQNHDESFGDNNVFDPEV